MNEILVGVDRSDRARAAAERAATIAAGVDATLHVIMCVDKEGAGVSSSDGTLPAKAAENKQFLEQLCAELPHQRVTNSVASGDPASVLCDEATRLSAQMIVVGNRRVQGVASALGSVARDVTKHAPCDVLIANTNG